MSFLAMVSKKVGIGVIFTIGVAFISDLLGFTGDFDFKAFLMKYKSFALGVAVGLVIGGIFKNWIIGVVAAVLAIFLFTQVVGL